MRRYAAPLVAAVTAALLAACGGTERAAPDPGSTPVAGRTATVAPTDTAAGAPAPTAEAPAGQPPLAPAVPPAVPSATAICGKPPQPAVDGPLDPDPAIAAQQRRRASFGLASDAATVRRVGAELPVDPADVPPAAYDFYVGYGVPVTVAEAVELARRQEANGRAAPRLERYGQRFPGTFAGVWLYHDAGGGVAIAFTDATETREREIAELDLGVPVRVAQARYSRRELDRVASAIVAAFQADGAPFAVATDVVRNVVAVHAPSDARTARLLAGISPADAICVDGPAETGEAPDGSGQAAFGDGWRLLADEPGRGPVWVADAATSQAQYDHLWQTLGLQGEPPRVDFATEIVLQLSPAVSGSCSEIRLTGLLIYDGIVRPEIELPASAAGGCTADANPHTYLLAVARATLPGTRFRVQLEDELCPGCDGSDAVDVDLTGPIPQTELAVSRCVDRWNRMDNAQLRARIAALQPERARVWRFPAGRSPAPADERPGRAGCAILLGSGRTARLAVRLDSPDAFEAWRLFHAETPPEAGVVYRVGDDARLSRP